MAFPDKRLFGALLASLAVHLGLVFGPPLPLPESHAPLMLEARLVPVAAPLPAIPKAKLHPRPRPHLLPPNEARQESPVAENPIQPALIQSPASTELTGTVPPTPSAPAQTTLPARAELRYALFKGDNGLNVGKVVQTWNRTGAAYTLTSTAEATGVFSLFFSGRHVQFSQGKIVASGLQPESFSMQRGSAEKRDTARFDWDAALLHLASEGRESTAKLAPGVLDLLSFVYQFAFSLPEPGSISDIRIDLTNGRKLDSYRYRIVAEENLETPLGSLKTVHLTKLHDPGEDGTEIWLGTEYHYLPVKIRQVDKKGDIAEQVITDIRYE